MTKNVKWRFSHEKRLNGRTMERPTYAYYSCVHTIFVYFWIWDVTNGRSFAINVTAWLFVKYANLLRSASHTNQRPHEIRLEAWPITSDLYPSVRTETENFLFAWGISPSTHFMPVSACDSFRFYFFRAALVIYVLQLRHVKWSAMFLNGLTMHRKVALSSAQPKNI